MEQGARRGLVAWAAVIAPLWVVLALCTYWEPVVRDGWGHVTFYFHHTLDLDTVWLLIRDSWLGSNPRLGQTVTTLLYAPGPYHVIITPILELGLFWLMTALVLGRWPSVRRADDALVFITVTAMLAMCAPQFGPMLFYRPFTGNYTFGLVLNLLWLVPYRMHAAEPRRWSWWWSPLWLVLGVAAGMCNEHTGPAFIAVGVVAVAWSLKRGGRLEPWMVAGLIGLVVGYLLLMFAPGHAARYGGLAKQAGVLERIVDRGVLSNFRIFGMLGLYLAWTVPWIVLAVIARRQARAQDPESTGLSSAQRAALVVLAGAGILTTVALLGSPKLGPRLYLHSLALIVIALTGWVVAQLVTVRARQACAIVSGLVLAYVGVRCVITYRNVGATSAQRLELLERGPKGAHVVVPRYSLRGSTWFLGEDFGAASLRAAQAAEYGLGSIELAGEAPPKR